MLNVVALPKGCGKRSRWGEAHCPQPKPNLQMLANAPVQSVATCVSFAQTLNIGVYKQLGEDGVYYGFKLGRPVPWCHGFPFAEVTGLRHPQYTSATLFFWGLCALLATPAAVEDGLVPMMVAWTLMYAAVSKMEQGGDGDATTAMIAAAASAKRAN